MEYALEGPGTGQSITGKLGWTQSAHDAATWATAALGHVGTGSHAALSVLGRMKGASTSAGWVTG